MSIKKAISLSFLLLANVVMLAHLVVFHHHDNQITATSCAAYQEHYCSENTEQHHCHDTKNTGKCCVNENCPLSTPFTKADDFKQIKPVFNNFDFIIINIFPTYQITQITDLVGLPFRQKPYLPLFYSEFISQSMGLRAPPAC